LKSLEPEPPKWAAPTTLVTTEKVRKKIGALKTNSAAGPDGIKPSFLQACKEELAPVVSTIFRKSLEKGEVPEEWRQANITPIFKKGSKTQATNYRPVSLTSVCCKMIESIIRDELVTHLKKNKLISSSQHGFMKNRSCATNLLEYLEYLTSEADKGQAIDVLYLDFAKALDKVPTQRLLKKLKAHGVEGEVYRWMERWLYCRQQRVKVGGKVSAWREVLSGVPQGSVLGPVLFIIFIDDLVKEVRGNQNIKLFADDTKVAQVIRNAQDAQDFQESINRLHAWTVRWGMAYNTAKCHIMHIGNRNEKNKYYMNDSLLATSEQERDIGVLISRNLKLEAQCKKAAAMANRVLTQILRAFHYRDRKTYLNLYKTYVRPHLEFAVVAWSPWNIADIKTLEKVQARAVKNVSGMGGLQYEDQLKALKLPSLAKRRKEFDMAQLFKIVKGIDNVNSDT